jgi:hypothetical protein
MDNDSFKIKYLKYKNKYLQLKKQLGGECYDASGHTMNIEGFVNFDLKPLTGLKPNERININDRCYSVRDLYHHINKNNYNKLDPNNNIINDSDYDRIIRAYIAINGKALKNHQNLNANHDVVKDAVTNNFWAIIYASDELKINDDIIQIASEKCNKKFVDDIFYKIDNNEVSKIKKQEYIRDLNLLPEKLLKILMNKNGLLLKYMNDNNRDKPNIVIPAITNNGWAIMYSSYRLKNNIKYIIIAYNNKNLSATNILNIINSLSTNKSSQEKLIFDLNYLPEVLLEMLMNENGLLLEYMDDNNMEKNLIVIAAIKQNPKALQFLSNKFYENLAKYPNEKFMLSITEVLKKNPNAVNYIQKKYRNDIEDMVNYNTFYKTYIFGNNNVETEPEPEPESQRQTKRQKKQMKYIKLIN